MKAYKAWADYGISIHALLAESDFKPNEYGDYQGISIHALLAESDSCHRIVMPYSQISIHALLAESDQLPSTACPSLKDFYPRSPCGERPFSTSR